MFRIIYLTYLLLLTLGIEAATISDMKINSPTSCLVYFDSIPDYSANLSNDKKSLTITFKNSISKSKTSQLHASGLINEIYLKNENNQYYLLINLSDKSGFNIIPLYYSNALKIDFFKWDKLSPAEDKFRTSMLGFEDELLNITSEGLKEAARDSIYEALDYLGIVFLKQGKINSAIKTFENAIERNSENWESYAALAQAFKIKGDTSESNKYRQLFLNKSGLEFINFIKIDSIAETNDNISEDLSFLHPINKYSTESDSIFNKKFENVFNKNDSTAKTKQKDDFFPVWFDYFIWILAVIGLLLVYFYLRWRQNQLKKKINQKTKSEVQTKTIESTNEDIKFDRNSFINRYKESLEQDISKISETESTQNTLIHDDKAENEAINKALEAIKHKQKETKTDNIEKDAKDAKLLLAMHLADEQNKIRTNEIKNFSQNLKNADLDKLNKIARKLGIEKGIEENANKFEQINSDKETLSKLAKKFGKKL